MKTIPHIEVYPFGSGSVKLVRPYEKEIRHQYRKAKADNQQIEFPYWARVWPSALVMTNYLSSHTELIAGKKVVEFAAGLGLPSLAAARVAKSVIATDDQQSAVDCMLLSIAENGFNNIQAKLYNWRESLPEWDADLILLSDTNYSPEDSAPVLQLILHYLNRKAAVLVTTPHRLAARSLLLSLQPYCIHSEMQSVEGSDISLYLYQL